MPKAEQKRRGRPPAGDKGLIEPLSIRFSAQMMQAIEAIQAQRMDAPDKSSIIRELVAEALQARARNAGGKR